MRSEHEIGSCNLSGLNVLPFCIATLIHSSSVTVPSELVCSCSSQTRSDLSKLLCLHCWQPHLVASCPFTAIHIPSGNRKAYRCALHEREPFFENQSPVPLPLQSYEPHEATHCFYRICLVCGKYWTSSVSHKAPPSLPNPRQPGDCWSCKRNSKEMDMAKNSPVRITRKTGPRLWCYGWG